jgi:hypothetical protein
LKPVLLMTIDPIILDPDYVYLQLNIDVVYDSKKTTKSGSQIQSDIKTAVQNYAKTGLNTFNSTFDISDYYAVVKNTNPAISLVNIKTKVQKKFYPLIDASKNYTLDYATKLNRAVLVSGISSYPSMQFFNPNDPTSIIDGVYIEELPTVTAGIDSVQINNPGYNYTYAPTVTILGDGVGATAYAEIIDGSISNIVVTDPGSGYTSALITLTNDPADTTGTGGSVTPILQGRYGQLRTYYFTSTGNLKIILNQNAGQIDYENGRILLYAFQPHIINGTYSQLTVTATPESNILYSTYNKILTLDPYDSSAIMVNITAKK